VFYPFGTIILEEFAIPGIGNGSLFLWSTGSITFGFSSLNNAVEFGTGNIISLLWFLGNTIFETLEVV
jgi:hypothetical protein